MFNVFKKPSESLLNTIAKGIATEYILQWGITHKSTVTEQDCENTDTGTSLIQL